MDDYCNFILFWKAIQTLSLGRRTGAEATTADSEVVWGVTQQGVCRRLS